MTRSVDLDHNATTPLDPRALEAMMPFLTTDFGNPSSSTHEWGLRARKAVEEARASVARLIGAQPEEIVFTSGATESNNLAIKGAARFLRRSEGGRHLLTTAVEHASVIQPVQGLADEGFEITVVAPDSRGVVHPERVQEAIRPRETVLASVIAASGEIATREPIEEIAAVCGGAGVVLHTDATQLAGRVPVDVEDLGVDLLSLSSHKLYGPKGVGALYVRTGVELDPLVTGGGQEHGLRSGTLNVPGIVGLGAAARICLEELESREAHLRELTEALWEGIRTVVPDAVLNGHPHQRVPGTLNVAFPRVNAERLMLLLRGFAFSSSSACQSGKGSPSPVLDALGMDPELVPCCVRFGLGRGTTRENLEDLVGALGKTVKRIRGPVLPTSA